MTNDEAKRVAEKITICLRQKLAAADIGEFVIRWPDIEDKATQIILAAQPEPPKGLREAVEGRMRFITNCTDLLRDLLSGNEDLKGMATESMEDMILTAVRPLVEAREKYLRYFLIMVPRHEYECTCELCKNVAGAQALIGGE